MGREGSVVLAIGRKCQPARERSTFVMFVQVKGLKSSRAMRRLRQRMVQSLRSAPGRVLAGAAVVLHADDRDAADGRVG